MPLPVFVDKGRGSMAEVGGEVRGGGGWGVEGTAMKGAERGESGGGGEGEGGRVG